MMLSISPYSSQGIRRLIAAGFFAGSIVASGASVISEDYESQSPGSYTGAWSFVYADGQKPVATTLSIGNGGEPGRIFYGGTVESPAGGNYLMFETPESTWMARVGQKVIGQDSRGNDILDSKFFTLNSFDSSAGYFKRTETLEAGQEYLVSLYRQIQIGQIDPPEPGFSVWDSSTMNAANDTGLIGRQVYDYSEGGWQRVDISFTAPGTLGSGTVPVAFTMGIYNPIPFGYGNEFDGNTATVDSMADNGYTDSGWIDIGGNFQQARYFMDGFTVTPIPEPTSALLLGVAACMSVLRRRR